MHKNLKPRMKHRRLTLLIEIFIVVILVVLDARGYLPITQTIYILLCIWIALKLKKETFESIGLGFRNINIGRSVLIGMALGIALELLATYLTTPIISGYFGSEPDLSGFRAVRGDVIMLVLFVALSWLLAAFGEEICFRGYLMNRLAGVLGNSDAAWVVSLVLSSILFGWGHSEQGIAGWIQEGLNGLFLGVIFLKSGKNLAIPIFAHGVANTLAFILIFLGKYPGTY